jgi:hypothetical protein
MSAGASSYALHRFAAQPMACLLIDRIYTLKYNFWSMGRYNCAALEGIWRGQLHVPILYVPYPMPTVALKSCLQRSRPVSERAKSLLM